MLFPFDPVYGLDDVTQNFEALQALEILDATPQNFLQLLAAGTVQIVYGTANATWAGASSTVVPAAIAHGLGHPPVIAGYWALTQAITGPVTGTNDAPPDVTNIYPELFTTGFTPAAATVTPFCWVAIG
jgi:hypothetical protein